VGSLDPESIQVGSLDPESSQVGSWAPTAAIPNELEVAELMKIVRLIMAHKQVGEIGLPFISP
jgi:hypothetical protein